MQFNIISKTLILLGIITNLNSIVSIEYPITRRVLQPAYQEQLEKKVEDIIYSSVENTKNTLVANSSVQIWQQILENNFQLFIQDYNTYNKRMYPEMCGHPDSDQAEEVFLEECQEILVNALCNKLESLNNKKEQISLLKNINIHPLTLGIKNGLIVLSYGMASDKVFDWVLNKKWTDLPALLQVATLSFLALPSACYHTHQSLQIIHTNRMKQIQRRALRKALKTIIQFEGKKFEILPKISLPIARKKVKHLLLCNIL